MRVSFTGRPSTLLTVWLWSCVSRNLKFALLPSPQGRSTTTRPASSSSLRGRGPRTAPPFVESRDAVWWSASTRKSVRCAPIRSLFANLFVTEFRMIGLNPEKCALCSDLVPCCDSFVTNPEEKGSGGNPLCNRHGAKAGELCGQCMDPTQKPGMSLNKRIAHLGGETCLGSTCGTCVFFDGPPSPLAALHASGNHYVSRYIEPRRLFHWWLVLG